MAIIAGKGQKAGWQQRLQAAQDFAAAAAAASEDDWLALQPQRQACVAWLVSATGASQFEQSRTAL